MLKSSPSCRARAASGIRPTLRIPGWHKTSAVPCGFSTGSSRRSMRSGPARAWQSPSTITVVTTTSLARLLKPTTSASSDCAVFTRLATGRSATRHTPSSPVSKCTAITTVRSVPLATRRSQLCRATPPKLPPMLAAIPPIPTATSSSRSTARRRTRPCP